MLRVWCVCGIRGGPSSLSKFKLSDIQCDEDITVQKCLKVIELNHLRCQDIL